MIISAGDNNHKEETKNTKKEQEIVENGDMQSENTSNLVGARDKFLQSLHSFCYPLST